MDAPDRQTSGRRREIYFQSNVLIEFGCVGRVAAQGASGCLFCLVLTVGCADGQTSFECASVYLKFFADGYSSLYDWCPAAWN
jgi:hypothetical protein